MGSSGSIYHKKKNLEITNLAKRIISYFLFQKKIERVFKFDNSELNNNYSDGNPKYSENKYNKYYIIDYNWIRTWKENSGYNKIKSELELIYLNNYDVINEMQRHCKCYEKNRIITNYEVPFSNNSLSNSLFTSNNKYCFKDFECLVNEETYKLFKKMSFWNNFGKIIEIDGIIYDKMIILFFEQIQLVKLIINGINDKKDEELIQLTSICYEFVNGTEEFDMEISESKYKTFKEYLINKSKYEILQIFKNEGIQFIKETTLSIDNFQIKIKNENLISKCSSQYEVKNKIINFNNINNTRLIGLENIGATCYMNATLQCFININSLTKYLLTESIYKQIDNNEELYGLSRGYCHLLEKVCLDDEIKNYYAPKEFKSVISLKNPLFQGINANDSKDLINFMLEIMNSELSKLNELPNVIDKKDNIMLDPNNFLLILENFRDEFSKSNKSIIAQNFFFIIQTNNKCVGCQYLKYNFQAMFLLEFPLELIYNYSLKQNIPLSNNQGKKLINLITCFEHYGQPSNFTGENQLYCNNCKGLRDAECINTLFSLPPVLIIILNRGKGKSFDCEVDFPEFLNLQNFVNYEKSIYEYQLRGVISHLGESGMSGHFIAYCRHRINNNWYCYNDAIVTLCQDQKKGFMTGTPYILFYETLMNQNNIIFDNNNIDVNSIKNNIFNSNINMNSLFNQPNFNNNRNFMGKEMNNIIIGNNMKFNMETNNNMINNFTNNNLGINNIFSNNINNNHFNNNINNINNINNNYNNINNFNNMNQMVSNNNNINIINNKINMGNNNFNCF